MFVIAALCITKDPTAMKDNATGSLDRRDFVIASLATVGASAAFAAAAGGLTRRTKQLRHGQRERFTLGT